MSIFNLKLEAFGGVNIKQAATEAVRIANQIGITVMFDFNGVHCMACPGDDPNGLASKQQELQEQAFGKRYLIARDASNKPTGTQP